MVLNFSQSYSLKIISIYAGENRSVKGYMHRHFINLSTTISFLISLSFYYSTALLEF